MILWPFKGKLTGEAPDVEQFMLPFITLRTAMSVQEELKVFNPLTPKEMQAQVQLSDGMGSDLDPLTEVSIEISKALHKGRAVPRKLFKEKVRLTAIRDCNFLLDKWLPLLGAFARCKKGRLRHAEFDAYLLPWLTPRALRCYASDKLYPRRLPTPEGLPVKDLWLYGHHPFKLILQDVGESLELHQVLPQEVLDFLSKKLGFTVKTV